MNWNNARMAAIVASAAVGSTLITGAAQADWLNKRTTNGNRNAPSRTESAPAPRYQRQESAAPRIEYTPRTPQPRFDSPQRTPVVPQIQYSQRPSYTSPGQPARVSGGGWHGARTGQGSGWQPPVTQPVITQRTPRVDVWQKSSPQWGMSTPQWGVNSPGFGGHNHEDHPIRPDIDINQPNFNNRPFFHGHHHDHDHDFSPVVIVDPYPFGYGYDPYAYPYGYPYAYPYSNPSPDVVYVPEAPQVVYVPQAPQVIYQPVPEAAPPGAVYPAFPEGESPVIEVPDIGGVPGENIAPGARIPGGANDAVLDIQEAWVTADDTLIRKHLDAAHPIRIYRAGKFDFTASTNDYLAMTRKALGSVSTQSFVLNQRENLPDGRVRACGTHVFYDPDDHRQVTYVCYWLKQVGDRWIITAINSVAHAAQPAAYQTDPQTEQPIAIPASAESTAPGADDSGQ
jgi:hypothetical protein